MHLLHYNEPYLQLYIIRILMMIPVSNLHSITQIHNLFTLHNFLYIFCNVSLYILKNNILSNL